MILLKPELPSPLFVPEKEASYGQIIADLGVRGKGAREERWLVLSSACSPRFPFDSSQR